MVDILVVTSQMSRLKLFLLFKICDHFWSIPAPQLWLPFQKNIAPQLKKIEVIIIRVCWKQVKPKQGQINIFLSQGHQQEQSGLNSEPLPCPLCAYSSAIIPSVLSQWTRVIIHLASFSCFVQERKIDKNHRYNAKRELKDAEVLLTGCPLRMEVYNFVIRLWMRGLPCLSLLLFLSVVSGDGGQHSVMIAEFDHVSKLIALWPVGSTQPYPVERKGIILYRAK